MEIVRISRDLKGLVSNYIEKCSQELIYTRDYIFQNRYGEAGKKLHAMKGVLGSMGFDRLYQMVVEAEDEIEGKRYEDARETILRMERYIELMEIEYIDEEI